MAIHKESYAVQYDMTPAPLWVPLASSTHFPEFAADGQGVPTHGFLSKLLHGG